MKTCLIIGIVLLLLVFFVLCKSYSLFLFTLLIAFIIGNILLWCDQVPKKYKIKVVDLPHFLFIYEEMKGSFSNAWDKLVNIEKKYTNQLKLFKDYQLTKCIICLDIEKYLKNKLEGNYLIGFAILGNTIDINDSVIVHFLSMSQFKSVEIFNEETYTCTISSNYYFTNSYQFAHLEKCLVDRGIEGVKTEDLSVYLSSNPKILFINNESITTFFPKALSTQFHPFMSKIKKDYNANFQKDVEINEDPAKKKKDL